MKINFVIVMKEMEASVVAQIMSNCSVEQSTKSTNCYELLDICLKLYSTLKSTQTSEQY